MVDYASTTNFEFIVDPMVLFQGWLIYSYLQIFQLIKCKWLPGECADCFFDIFMTWSYCLHRWYSMSRQKNRIFINEHVLNREPVPLNNRSLDFVYIKKMWTGSEGHSPSWVKFSECLYAKKVDPFARAKIDCAFSDSPALNELSRLDKPKCLRGETLDWSEGWPH